MKQSDVLKRDGEAGTIAVAERIRVYTYDRIISPALRAGQAEIVVRAGDIHSAMRLTSRLPAVCAALESRKFTERYGLVLTRREGPPRGSNVFFHFRPAELSQRQREADPPRSNSPAMPAAGAGRAVRLGPIVRDEVDFVDATYWISCVSGKRSTSATAKTCTSPIGFRGRADMSSQSARRGMCSPRSTDSWGQTKSSSRMSSR